MLKRSNCPKLISFSKNNWWNFHTPISPFHSKKSWGCTIFGPKMAHLSWTILFRYKLLLLLSSACWTFSLCKIKKRFLQWIQSYEDVQYLGPKLVISPNESFFKTPINEPCFFHLYLSTCQKSKSYTNLLVKYWRLKNT